MATLKRIFLLLTLLCTLQAQAQYVIIDTPTGFLTPVCPMDSNGSSATVQVTMHPNVTWGPGSGSATFELVNVYNTTQVYSSKVAPAFPVGGSATVTFKLPKLNAYCNDTFMMQVRVTIPGATPATIYSSTAIGVRYLYTGYTVMNSNAPYQDLIPYYIEHCPGVFPQLLGAASASDPSRFYKWQVKVGGIWTNIFPGIGGNGYTTSVTYNAMVNGTYRCVVRSPTCGNCYTVTSDFIVKDIDALQIASSIPGASPQLYTSQTLQRSAPGASHTYTNYQWYRNGIPIPGATSNAYTPLKKGTYTLSGTGPCGWQVSNAFELIGSCDSPKYDKITGPNLSGTYTGRLVMSGEYTVPSGSTAVFSTADVIMLPCTRITVASGGTLVVRASNLWSCRQWYGIVVAGRGTFTMDNSSISDAYIAVSGIDDNAKIDIQRSTFRDNHLSIWSRKNRTRNVQDIHDNNLFTDIDLTNGARWCDNIQSVATIIDPLHDHIFVDGSNEVNIVKNNTFEGFPVLIPQELYPCPVIAVQANKSASMLISSANKFDDVLLHGVLLNDCAKTWITDGNQFTALAYFGNAISINGGSDITINKNTVRNYTYGVKGNKGNHISVLSNSFVDNIFGISLTGLTSYNVNSNTIDSRFTGMETYNDNFTTATPPPHKISNNTFKNLYQGLVVSPVKNPLYSTTTAGNMLVAGPQNVQILCNSFNANTIAITGSAPIVDQYYQGQQWAGNTFNQNALWDIAWVDSVTSPAMNYYHDASLIPPNVYIPNNSTVVPQPQPAFAMNGIPVTTAFVAVTPNSNGVGDCSYDPFSSVAPRPAGVEGAVSNSNVIQIHPNPAQDKLMIKAAGGAVFSYNITNVAGQVVRTGDKGSHTQINVAQLRSGMYLLKLIMADGKTNIYKFVKE